MIFLTVKQATILEALCDLGPGAHGPTKIGLTCGKPYSRASSWVSGGMGRLIAGGYVRIPNRGTYELTLAGMNAVAALRS